MEEVLDIIISRIIFALFMCFIIYIYKYAHYALYPVGKKQVARSFNLFNNPADSLHYLSRILGMAIILSQIKFDRFFSLTLNSMNIFIIALVSIVFYLLSVFITDTVILNKYKYVDEILKKKNYTFALINFAKNICLALLIQKVYLNSQNSLIIYLILWTYMNVLFLIMSKCYPFFSHFPFHKMIIKDNPGMAISYWGFLLGNTLLFFNAFDGANIDVLSYIIRVFLKVFLGLLFIPLFLSFFKFLIPYQDKEFKKSKTLFFKQEQSLSLGFFEGIIYLTSCLFTSWIIYKINLTGIFSNY